MSIQIHRELCIGCGRCEEACPGTLIALEEGVAQMKYPSNCWGCAACVKECPKGAIAYFLGADIGGNGGRMKVLSEGNILHWQIEKRDGTVTVIDVDRSNANKY